MSSVEEIAGLIRSVVVRELGGDTRIVSVAVSEGIDHLGEDIFEVNVVYDERVGTPKAVHTVGLIRLIRAALDETFGEQRFPVVYLTSREDAEADAA